MLHSIENGLLVSWRERRCYGSRQLVKKSFLLNTTIDVAEPVQSVRNTKDHDLRSKTSRSLSYEIPSLAEDGDNSEEGKNAWQRP